MRAVLMTVGACVLCSGCALVGEGARNLLSIPAQAVEQVREGARNRRLARAAWQQARAMGGPYSEDYGDGFCDGFVDHLEFGGHGEPPPLPPRRYWGVNYQTAEGNLAVQDWFAGFRHGAAVAMQTGYRRWITLPTSGSGAHPPWLPPHEHPPILAPGVPPAAGLGVPVAPGATPAPQPEEAPAPRPGPAPPSAHIPPRAGLGHPTPGEAVAPDASKLGAPLPSTRPELGSEPPSGPPLLAPVAPVGVRLLPALPGDSPGLVSGGQLLNPESEPDDEDEEAEEDEEEETDMQFGGARA
ncbi:MAG: hypothetical protein IT429_18995 [Gemmataceae bacterium]|nr:hypothetical protein [Gemmataceae bacterium]